MLEREVKLRFPNPDEARRAIVAAGAQALRRRRLQVDLILDTGEGVLRQRRSVLRIRTEAGQSLLTYKGPVQPGTMKVREEHETGVADGEVLLTVLHELGLDVRFRYEKYREEYTADDVIVALDETPIGTFVEIEGGEAGILAMAQALGRSPADFILESYRSLFVAWRAAQGLTGGDMTFPAA